MSLASRAFFVSGLLIAFSAVLIPWSGVNWMLYIFEKWAMGSLGLLLVLEGSFLTLRELMRTQGGIEGFHTFVKYMSLSGMVVSVAIFYFGSWIRPVVLLLGVALNVALVIYTWRVKNIKMRSQLYLLILLVISFVAVIVWNFFSTMLSYR